jgi:hypothetical protein
VINIVAPASSKPSSGSSGTTSSSKSPTDWVVKDAVYKSWYSSFVAQNKQNPKTFAAATIKKFGEPWYYCITMMMALQQAEGSYLSYSQQMAFRNACEDFIKSKR